MSKALTEAERQAVIDSLPRVTLPDGVRSLDLLRADRDGRELDLNRPRTRRPRRR